MKSIIKNRIVKKESKGNMKCTRCGNETDLREWIDFCGQYVCPICYGAYTHIKEILKDPGMKPPEEPIKDGLGNMAFFSTITFGIGLIFGLLIHLSTL
jgi:late competence protein required for DNA uptake (superfamily II DNA/RNA helicase)